MIEKETISKSAEVLVSFAAVVRVVTQRSSLGSIASISVAFFARMLEREQKNGRGGMGQNYKNRSFRTLLEKTPRKRLLRRLATLLPTAVKETTEVPTQSILCFT